MRSATCQQSAAGAATSRQAQGAQCPGPSRGRDPHDSPRDDDGAVRHTPDLPTVLAWAIAIGCPPDKAEIWFLEHDARPLTPHGRWTDRDGNAVQRPHSALAAWWQKWRANDHQRSTRQHAPSSTGYHATARPASPRTDTANLPGRYA